MQVQGSEQDPKERAVALVRDALVADERDAVDDQLLGAITLAGGLHNLRRLCDGRVPIRASGRGWPESHIARAYATIPAS
jgi:hypothetical protein